jgi:hypothetical protein
VVANGKGVLTPLGGRCACSPRTSMPKWRMSIYIFPGENAEVHGDQEPGLLAGTWLVPSKARVQIQAPVK